MQQDLIDRIDRRLAADRDEITRLQGARIALTDGSVLEGGSSGPPAVRASTLAEALVTIAEHPGEPRAQLGIGRRTIAALHQEGRIHRYLAGWAPVNAN